VSGLASRSSCSVSSITLEGSMSHCLPFQLALNPSEMEQWGGCRHEPSCFRS